MILGGKTILESIGCGDISIVPFNEKQLNPNSYNLTLDNKLMVYGSNVFYDGCGDVQEAIVSKGAPLDMKKINETRTITIPERGLLLKPRCLYLGTTVETTSSAKYVPMLEGRSSVGRLGMSIHITAGFGDIGFNGKWTLEISVVEPLIIYPYIEIAQIYFHTITDNSMIYRSDKYQNQNGVTASKMYMDFK